jgi:hypothetical protein
MSEQHPVPAPPKAPEKPAEPTWTPAVSIPRYRSQSEILADALPSWRS